MLEYHLADVNILKNIFNWVDVYIAELDTKTVSFIEGFKYFNPHNSYFFYIVSSVFVNDNVRRKEIGKAFLENFIKDKQGENIRWFVIDVFPSSDVACKFYVSLGFQKKEIVFLNYRPGFSELNCFYKKIS